MSDKQKFEVEKPQDLSRQKFFGKDFSGQNLRKARMNASTFKNCIFDRADLTDANCEGSEFHGSTFKNSVCVHTNFRAAKMQNVLWAPADAFGCTFSMTCQTYRGMKFSRIWFLSHLQFALMMEADFEGGKQMQDAIIAAMGTDTYVKMQQLFRGREI